jgi:RNA polymerase sigma-54 factor
MAYELKQQLKLTQQLIMTPQLQQAIKLLQLSTLELSDLLQQEINENPVLDEILGDSEKDRELAEDGAPVDSAPDPLPELDGKPEFDWRDYVDKSAMPRSSTSYQSEDRDEFEPIITKRNSLVDHLMWQLHLHLLSEVEQTIGEYIIGNLNKDGYLQTTVDEIARDCGADEETIETVLEKIKKLDPVGVASRTLQECLLAQVELLPGDQTLVKRILQQQMSNLEGRRYQLMAKDLKVSLEEIVHASQIISNMEPRPGRGFSENETQYVVPDIYVYKLNDDYVVVLNEDGQPKLRINSFYKKALADPELYSPKTRDYIQEKLRAAVWLIKSIYHRQGTIVNVMKSIIKFQRDFFDHGVGNLKPLVLRDVAEDISMHESNISRVTTNKYVHTQHGVFELKYFFNSGLTSDSGENIASESVKNKIKELLQTEDPHKPLSDQDFADTFKLQGINIARRTVTKYREMLGILSSSKRKKLF